MHIIFEGIDHCGKDTIIDTFMQTYAGRVHHCGKPFICNQFLSSYIDDADSEEIYAAQYFYQKKYFENLFQCMAPPEYIPLIDFRMHDFNVYYNRFHLGEYVYGYLYRNYSSDMMENVFKIEDNFLAKNSNKLDRNGTPIDIDNWVRLILLAMHHPENRVHDDEAFSNENGKLEQQLFINAFNKSKLYKAIIYTDTLDGKWRPKSDIFNDILTFLEPLK